MLTVREVDMCFTSNGTEHHTSHFDLMTRHISPHLVVRRGQPYQLDIVLSRGYNPTTDAISFIFTLAGKLFKNTTIFNTNPIYCRNEKKLQNENYTLCITENYSSLTSNFLYLLKLVK